uniref:CID domain-containing protein n=1 Tax=Timema shepardi TaxID=629360 RepID=A0A7R9AXV8_TIMSH|nr:unnamed protein product [Timema shepardi]
MEQDKLASLLENVPGCDDVTAEDIREWIGNNKVYEITNNDITKHREKRRRLAGKISSNIRKGSRLLRQHSILKQKATRDTQVGAVLAAGMPPHMLNNTAGSAASTPLTLAAAAQWLALPSLTLDTLTTQQGQLQDQIRQSEQNLAAQHTVLMQQQQTQIEDALRKSQEDALQRASEEAGISINEFDSVLQPIVDSCTKDSISSGKGWILQRSTSPKADEVIALHLLRKVIAQGCPFNQKLHIIYLVNDVLHHCARKNAEDLKKALENVVVPMFCNSSIGITEEQQLKLNKLLNLWESKNNYFDTAIVAKLKNPSRSWSEYQAGLITQHAAAITPITTSTKQTYEGYQAQHQAFIQHALQQIQLPLLGSCISRFTPLSGEF